MDSKEIDVAVLALLVKVNEKKKEIEAAKVRPSWLTSCTIPISYPVTVGSVNIQTVRDEKRLLEIYAELTRYNKSMEESAKDLGTAFDGTIHNFPIADWKKDIQTRMNQLSVDRKEKELKELDDRVNRLVSSDQRRVMELKALQDILK